MRRTLTSSTKARLYQKGAVILNGCNQQVNALEPSIISTCFATDPQSLDASRLLRRLEINYRPTGQDHRFGGINPRALVSTAGMLVQGSSILLVTIPFKFNVGQSAAAPKET